MAGLQVEHEIHQRRKGRNFGVGLLLLSFVALVFGLTMVKVMNLNDITEMERFDHVVRPALEAAAEDASAQEASE